MSQISEGPKGKILVVDDEQLILQITDQILRQAGYDVALAQEGSQAVEVYQEAMQQDQPFELVIVDLTLAGSMGGMETMQRLWELGPATKAIVTSGYVEDPTVANYKDFGFSGALKKPYGLSDLMKAVETALV
jgi:CheY-like chemotaxis protein